MTISAAATRERLGLVVTALGVGVALGALSGPSEGASRALNILANLTSPWALGALVVGRLAASPKTGALAGGLTLVVGMATFYGLTTGGPYIRSTRDLVWLLVAITIGPLMGVCGALLSSRRTTTPTAAVVIPSAILLAETIWIAVDRRIWLWNLRLEPQRFTDVVILFCLIAVALAVPLLFVQNRRRLLRIYLVILASGLVGAAGLALLYWTLVNV